MTLLNSEFSFKGNILGFENLDKFTLSSISNTAFYQLNSIEDPNIQFVLIHPFDWLDNYELKLNNNTLDSIDLSSAEDAIVMNIVTIKEPFSNSTVNYMAPLIMNVENGLATQYVIQDASQYSSHAPLITNDIGKGGDFNASTD